MKAPQHKYTPQDFPGVVVGEFRAVLHSGKDHVARRLGEFTRERELIVLMKRHEGAKRHKADSRLRVSLNG